MYGKPSPIAALAAAGAGSTVLGLSVGVTVGIIAGIIGLVVLGLIIVRITSRRGRR